MVWKGGEFHERGLNHLEFVAYEIGVMIGMRLRKYCGMRYCRIIGHFSFMNI